jgi:hypothetical protein
MAAKPRDTQIGTAVAKNSTMISNGRATSQPSSVEASGMP